MSGVGFRVWGAECRVKGVGCRVKSIFRRMGYSAGHKTLLSVHRSHRRKTLRSMCDTCPLPPSSLPN